MDSFIKIRATKKEYPFLKSVHSSPLKNTALRISESIQAYQESRKGRRMGRQSGWPRHRSWSEHYFSPSYDEPNKEFKVSGCDLYLSLGTEETGKRFKVKGLLEVSPL